MYAYKRIFRSLSALLMLLPVAAMAATITGTVTNRTTDKPAAGDTVTLLQQGMTELATGKTDAKGQFSINAPASGPFLLRVTHDMAAYYESATEGQPVNVDVYSAGAHVVGVTTEVLMLRAQTDPSGAVLNVTEDFVVKNASKPPMTQFSKAPFNLYLPAGAVVEATAAKGPNGMPTAEDLTPQGEKGLYSVMFPIKPGETQIEIAYHIPYTGNLKVDLKMAGQVDMFAVSLPKSMKFDATDGKFIPANGDLSATTFLRRNLKAGDAVSFGIEGSGQLPRDTQGSDQSAQGQPGAADGSAGAPVDNAPGKGLGNPLDPNGTREPVSTKYKWWILGGLGLLLVAAAGVLLRKPAVAPVVGAAASQDVVRPLGSAVASSLPVVPTSAGHQAQLMQVLKEELFGLETDRLQGHVSEAEYAQSKAAIELILRRALQRGAVTGSVPPATSTV
ncbi:carboxypeptidase-like regulatory domain-containing protein [Granulicella sp. L46]|uniref:carboxypeptidase-like regulatory domain-containing protein n=1 Tax=Granulicella sp. L46 TaxID=1641865 RepID=UPI00131D3347|nr:carboxypeptidase-like regulatory domain-containing protein [Granulicella sp. L46]